MKLHDAVNAQDFAEEAVRSTDLPQASAAGFTFTHPIRLARGSDETRVFGLAYLPMRPMLDSVTGAFYVWRAEDYL